MYPLKASTGLVRFGPFELNLQTGELRKYGTRVRVPEQSLKVLLRLIERPGELVSREDLRQRLWTADTFVNFDHGLNLAVLRLRQALGDAAESPRYVETLPRKGYRFIGKLEPVVQELPPIDVSVNGHVPAPKPSSAAEHKTVSKVPHWGWTVLAAGIVVAVIGWSWSQRRVHPAPVFSAVPLTSYVGRQLCASFAPDGERIAFSWDGEKQDNPNIYVKQIGVERLLRLTVDPMPDLSPAWSPDGRTIAFLRLSSPEKLEIWLTSSLGGGSERRLAELAVPYSGYLDRRLLAWSPDGKWLVVSDERRNDASSGLFLLSVSTGSKRRLTLPPPMEDDLDPAFSSDMRRLAFVRRSGVAGDLYVLELTTDLHSRGEPRRLTFDRGSIGSPVWMPNGTLLFTRYLRPGSPNLWSITLSNPQRLEALPIEAENASFVAVSPKGNRIVYTRELHNTNIWAADLCRNPRPNTAAWTLRPLIRSSRDADDPAFSPDGGRIAFQSSSSGWGEVWVADRDGSHPHQLTDLRSSAAGFPRWSPDGRTMVFHTRQRSYGTLFLLDVPTAQPKPLTYKAVNGFQPSWSRDGKWIYFASRRSGDLQIWKIPPEGGTPLQLTKNGGWYPLESLDGRYLFYTKSGDFHLWRIPCLGGREEQAMSYSVAANGSAYAPGREGIYFIDQASHIAKQRLAFFSFATGRTTTLAQIPKPVELGLAVSPDEREVLYSQVDHVSSELMLVENFR